MLLVQVSNRSDVDKVLEGRPLVFDKHVFLVNEVGGEAQLRRTIMDTSPFRLFDLPISAWKESTIRRLASKLVKSRRFAIVNRVR